MTQHEELMALMARTDRALKVALTLWLIALALNVALLIVKIVR